MQNSLNLSITSSEQLRGVEIELKVLVKTSFLTCVGYWLICEVLRICRNSGKKNDFSVWREGDAVKVNVREKADSPCLVQILWVHPLKWNVINDAILNCIWPRFN